jgi:tyrosine aminotransferase
MRSGWDVACSDVAKNTSNPIRKIVDRMSAPPNPDKPKIALSIGDPCVFGNFACPEHFHDELRRVSVELKHNGYAPAVGSLEARESVAVARSVQGAPLTAADIILTSGCSHALEMCFGTLYVHPSTGCTRADIA